jgi:beta-glucosidase
VNEQETNRTATTPAGRSNSIVDDRTMHEIYLWPWADGVKSGLGSVMCSMNRVNGVMACENEAILTGLLKKELGFKGMV